MNKKGFSIRCATCGAKIRFNNEKRIGEIIPCPNCESMVLVEPLEELSQSGEKSGGQKLGEPIVPTRAQSEEEQSDVLASISLASGSDPRLNIPTPPPPPVGLGVEEVPRPPLLDSASNKVASNSEKDFISESGSLRNTSVPPSDADFAEEESLLDDVPPLSPAKIALTMGGVALVVFALVVGGYWFFSSGGNAQRQMAKNSGKNAEQDETPKLATGDFTPFDPDASSGAGENLNATTHDAADAAAHDGATPGADATNDEGDTSDGGAKPDVGDVLPGVIESEFGREVFEALEGKTPPKTDSIPNSERESETQTTSEAESATDFESSEADAQNPTEVAADDDALVFRRRKRSEIYSGEDDPALGFVTRQKTEEEKGGFVSPEDAPGAENSEDSENSENSENDADPADDAGGEAAEGETIRVGEKRSKVPQKEYLNASVAQKLAIPLGNFDSKGKKVSDIIRFGTQMSGVRIVADWKSLLALGARPDDTIDVRLEDTTLREALDVSLAQRNLALIPSGTQLRVAGLDAAIVLRLAAANNERMETLALDADDLTSNMPRGEEGQSGTRRLAQLLQSVVHPGVWAEAGGPGKISVSKSGQIQIRHYPTVLREVEVFCDKLRVARGKRRLGTRSQADVAQSGANDGTAIASASIENLSKASEKVRLSVVDLDCSDGMRVRDVLHTLFAQAGAKIVIDEDAMATIPISAVVKDADVPDFEGKRRKLPDSVLDLPFVYNFENLTLEEAIRIVLAKLPVWCYPVAEDQFYLTTRVEAERKLILEFYSIRDIVSSNSEAGKVANAIQSAISPGSWSARGGRGRMEYDAPSGSLIVLQSPQTLALIEEFFRQYRERAKPMEEQ
ncbi:MAG: hypothetical protein Q4D38_07025 [Planctomycetia bacterium]|nr:hypothetical protein [Planctomycetia bacterium]